jgi:hypothetical protein
MNSVIDRVVKKIMIQSVAVSVFGIASLIVVYLVLKHVSG